MAGLCSAHQDFAPGCAQCRSVFQVWFVPYVMIHTNSEPLAIGDAYDTYDEAEAELPELLAKHSDVAAHGVIEKRYMLR